MSILSHIKDVLFTSALALIFGLLVTYLFDRAGTEHTLADLCDAISYSLNH